MPEGYEFKVDFRPALRDLEYLARFLVDLRSFWPMLSRAFVGWMSEQFETEGASWTGGWQELSEPYATWKADHFPGKGILSMYGDLRRAATTPRREATPRTLLLTIDGYTHSETGREMDPSWFQEGTARMPARPLIGEVLTPAMEGELNELAERYVGGLIDSLGRH